MITGKKLAILIYIAVMLPVGLGAAVKSGEKPAPAFDREQPIQITSDRMDAYHDKKMIVFTGSAVAIQGIRTIKSDRLTLFYKEGKQTPAKAGIEGTGNLEKVEAKGSVTITEGERIVSGDDAVFEQDAQKITVTGNAVMREGVNIIRGDRLVVFMLENRGVVESVENKRVKATIYPGEAPGKKP